MNFDDTFNNVMNQIDLMVRSDTEHKVLKNYISELKHERYLHNKKDKQEEIANQKKHNQFQKNMIVGIREINEHKKEYDKIRNHNIAIREINRFKQIEKNNEFNTKMENEMRMNKQRVDNYDKYNNSQRYTTEGNTHTEKRLKQKAFNTLVNKMNKEIIEKKKVLSPPIRVSIIKQESINDIHINKKNIKTKLIKLDSIRTNKNNDNKTKVYTANISHRNILSSLKKKQVMPISTMPNNLPEVIKSAPIKKDYLKEGLKYAKRNLSPINDYGISHRIKSNYAQYVNTMDHLKYQASKYEDLAKKQEQLLKISGTSSMTANQADKYSNFLINSISAKLSYIKGIDQ